MKDKEEKKVYYVMLKKGSHTDLEQHKGEFVKLIWEHYIFIQIPFHFVLLNTICCFIHNLYSIYLSLCVCVSINPIMISAHLLLCR